MARLSVEVVLPCGCQLRKGYTPEGTAPGWMMFGAGMLQQWLNLRTAQHDCSTPLNSDFDKGTSLLPEKDRHAD
jgi:hypothetical protein